MSAILVEASGSWEKQAAMQWMAVFFSIETYKVIERNPTGSMAMA